MFEITGHINEYFIIYISNTKEYWRDYEIVTLLKSVIPNITLQKYQDLLKKYDGIIELNVFLNNDESYFKNREDVEKCVLYLNEKYGIVLKLLE